MVAGSIEERIKKMKEAILSEAKERASTIVKNADEEANNERAMLFNHEKEKIHQEFILLNKSERVKEKMYWSINVVKSRLLTIAIEFAEWQYVMSMSKNWEKKFRKNLEKWWVTPLSINNFSRNSSYKYSSSHLGNAQNDGA